MKWWCWLAFQSIYELGSQEEGGSVCDSVSVGDA